MKYFSTLFLIFFLLFTSGCAQKDRPALRIAVNPWIGYSPLYYAEEMGWLKEANVKLIHSTSLHETIHYFQGSLIDGFVSTQYEASIINHGQIIHAMPIDRSNGGDVVLSNVTMDELKTAKNIVAYLEMDSVNHLLFTNFIEKTALNPANIKIINTEQVMIKLLKPESEEKIILVTYEPYATILRNSGFQQIASTADPGLLVLDSLYVNRDTWRTRKESVADLQDIILRAYRVLKDSPEHYYDKVKHHLENPDYEEFTQSLNTLEWLLEKPASELSGLISDHKILPFAEDR